MFGDITEPDFDTPSITRQVTVNEDRVNEELNRWVSDTKRLKEDETILGFWKRQRDEG